MVFRPVTGSGASGASDELKSSLFTVFLVATSMNELGAKTKTNQGLKLENEMIQI